MSSPRLVNYSKSKSSKKVSSANKNLFFDQFMEKRSSPTKYATASSKRSPAKGVKVARRGKSVRNVETKSTKVGAHSALSQGNMRCSAKASALLAEVALKKGNEISDCIVRGARSSASLNGRKTVMEKDIRMAMVANCVSL